MKQLRKLLGSVFAIAGVSMAACAGRLGSGVSSAEPGAEDAANCESTDAAPGD